MKLNRQFKKKFSNAGIKLTALDALKQVKITEPQLKIILGNDDERFDAFVTRWLIRNR